MHTGTCTQQRKDQFQKHYIDQKEPDTRDYLLNDCIYMKLNNSQKLIDSNRNQKQVTSDMVTSCKGHEGRYDLIEM